MFNGFPRGVEKLSNVRGKGFHGVWKARLYILSNPDRFRKPVRIKDMDPLAGADL